MYIKKLRISNWKSFEYNESPRWIEFGMLNIFIGPNSEGKTNLANALRVMFHGGPDYSEDKKLGRKAVECRDFNDDKYPIKIEAYVEGLSKPVPLEIDPNNISEKLSPNGQPCPGISLIFYFNLQELIRSLTVIIDIQI